MIKSAAKDIEMQRVKKSKKAVEDVKRLERVDAMNKDNDSQEKIFKEAEIWLSKRQDLLKMSEVSLILDTYDDIFSDFDPRPYNERALSDDLLLELKRATRERSSGVIELKFLVPLHARDLNYESLIKRRLKDHFKKHYEYESTEIGNMKKKGILLAGAGLTLSALAAVVLPNASENVFFNVIIVLIEPAAWFTIWTGFDSLFNLWRQREPDQQFYNKMTKSEITFIPY
ncbi:MAG: hypothetical protein AABW59_01325 [archaeon]